MRKVFILIVLIVVTAINAQDNNSTENNISKKEDIIKKQVEEQIKREEKYAKEQRFYQGSDYNLSASEINKKSLDSIKSIEPDYDFNMDDAYSDEQ